MDLGSILISLSRKRPIFHNEADFQHALAWQIREHYPEATIRMEMKIHGPKTNVYLDILVENSGRKYAIELKYKTRSFNCTVDGEEFFLSNHGAQDTGRYDVLKDLERLEQMVEVNAVDEGFLIFLTNDASYYFDPGNDKETVDAKFRIHEGKSISGQLSWAEYTGLGTMKGREAPIAVHGQYGSRWTHYSNIEDKSSGLFRYLMLSVRDIYFQPAKSSSPSPLTAMPQKRTVETRSDDRQLKQIMDISWFDSFAQSKEIPVSQRDLRDKLAQHFRRGGHNLSVTRELGTDKVDLWAEKDGTAIAIEVRNKTALLQTIYRGIHIELKNQAAQDISRYDFINDIAKLERIVKHRPNVKGYAILLTNDPLYWMPPKKSDSVDRAFRIHHGNTLTGLCAWSDQASTGTTSGRQYPISLSGTYDLQWQSYLTLGNNKTEEFRVLVVEVASGNLSESNRLSASALASK